MSSRNFSQKQKTAVAIVTERTGDGDHIKPYSKGGKTTVENCQLLPSKTNRKKSAFNFEPREWQSALFEKWGNRIPGKPFMLIAIPGSGKTFAALEVARKWMAAGADRRVVVVVPSDNLRNQWKSEALKFGIDLQTKEFGTNFKEGYQGGVATYHLVGNNSLIFRKLCSVSPTMVIFDEIHHCGDDSHFGKGIQEGFGLAKEKLLMSGTPWKSDGTPIPFVRYDGSGYAISDFGYELPDALMDEVVRYLVFEHASGSITNEFTKKTSEISERITDQEASKRLTPLLDAKGEYLKQQILDAHRKLMECRKQIPDAAALAVCIDQYHAAKVAELIEKLTGCKPSLIVSDSNLENDSVDLFRNSNKEWLVSVKKVSEGTDIKRLQVLCYATNVTTELFFRQVIGRVARVRNMEDYEAYVYLPADPRLIFAARNIENAQVLALKEESETIKRDLENTPQPIDLAYWSTEHTGTETVIISSEQLSKEEYKIIEAIAEATGTPSTKVKEIIAMSKNENFATPAEPKQQTKLTREEKELALRKECNHKAWKLSKRLQVDVAEIHKKFKPHKESSVQELTDKLEALERRIAYL